MTDEERELTKRWVETWKRAGPLLQAIRDEEIRAAKTADAFTAFASLSEHWIRTNPPLPSSGLVEQQRWFRKLTGQ
ncbi:MAG: hypothetical protein ACR2OZ_01690 [Verrucomicrobiales bacterium]